MTKINTTSMTKIGNMTQGGGLSALFDDNTGTAGRYEGTLGWAGVHLNGKKVDKVRLVSATNGFDASGSTGPIAIYLYGKNGSAPTTHNDGSLLGKTWFKDKNTQRARSLLNDYPDTIFDYCWVVIVGGVWSTACEIEFYEYSQTAPLAHTLNVKPYFKRCDNTVVIPQVSKLVREFDIDFYSHGGKANVDFQANFEHAGDTCPGAGGYSGALGLGVYVYHQHASTFAELNSANLDEIAVSGSQIDDRFPEHYDSVSIVSSTDLLEGYHRFRVYASVHTDGSSLDGLGAILAEGDMVQRGLNGFRVTEFVV